MYVVTKLQAAELEALPRDDPRVTVVREHGFDSMGLPRVTVLSEDRDELIAFVREHWGDDDEQWFADYVDGRIVQTFDARLLTNEDRLIAVDHEWYELTKGELLGAETEPEVRTELERLILALWATAEDFIRTFDATQWDSRHGHDYIELGEVDEAVEIPRRVVRALSTLWYGAW